MKTYLIIFGISCTILSCSQQRKDIKIKTKTFYSKEGITRISEIDIDSLLNGKTTWYDSLGKIYLEENYLKGELSGISKEYYTNGIVRIEKEYFKGKIICTKEFSESGLLRFQNPIDLKDVGPLKIVIKGGSRNYLIKDQEDTIEFISKNLPSGNQTISTNNAYLTKKVGNGWIIKPNNKSNKVKVYLGYRKDYSSKEKIIDSAIIEIKQNTSEHHLGS